MKIAATVLIIIGVLMLIFNGINYKTEKNVIDAGPIKVNKEESKHVGWPAYAGGAIALVGLGLMFVPTKK